MLIILISIFVFDKIINSYTFLVTKQFNWLIGHKQVIWEGNYFWRERKAVLLIRLNDEKPNFN